MKKVLAILCAVLMVFAFAACGGKNSAKNNADMESYLAENKEEIAEDMLEEMGLSGECTVYVEGNGFVFEIKSSDLDGLSDDIKAELRDSAGEAAEDFDEVVEDMREDDERLKDAEYLTVKLMDSKGSIIATISNK